MVVSKSEQKTQVILETERLILRTWSMDDLDAMAAIDCDLKVGEFLPRGANRAATEAGIQRIMKHYQEKGFSLYAVELKATHEFIGFVGLSTPSFQAHFTPTVEIGWRLGSQHWNKGYATEAAKAVMHYAFTVLDLKELVSFTVVANQASRRVMEKIGLHHEPQHDFDHPNLEEGSPLKRHVLYRLSKKDYFSERGA
jgi:RimJ/RimL family protein N-acetyltransferase